MARTITSANSVYQLTIPNLYPAAQQLQGYSADAAFETAAAQTKEKYKGVDGLFSAGYVPFMTEQTITLNADSPSVDIFENWLQAEKIVQEVYQATAVIRLVAVGKVYYLSQGVLDSIIAVPNARKTFGPRTFVITWGDISPAPI